MSIDNSKVKLFKINSNPKISYYKVICIYLSITHIRTIVEDHMEKKVVKHKPFIIYNPKNTVKDKPRVNNPENRDEEQTYQTKQNL